MYEIFRTGEVSDIDASKGKVRVLFKQDDETTSDWLNILVPYSESHSDNYMLKVGQTVYCLFFPEFLEQGVVIGAPMRGSCENEEVRRTFSDGGFYKYLNGTLTIQPIEKIIINAPKVEVNSKTILVNNKDSVIINTNSAVIKAKANIKLDSPQVDVSGNLTVKGTTITGGSINLNTHKHEKVSIGTALSGGPV